MSQQDFLLIYFFYSCELSPLSNIKFSFVGFLLTFDYASVIFSLLFLYQFCSGLLYSFMVYVQCSSTNILSSFLFFRMPLQFVHFQVRFYILLTCKKKFTISIFIGTKLYFNLNLEKINIKFRENFHSLINLIGLKCFKYVSPLHLLGNFYMNIWSFLLS